MSASFAQFRHALHALLATGVLALAGCASLPPPSNELSAARQAVAFAEGVDADQYAADDLDTARRGLQAAEAAFERGRNNDARALAQAATVDADTAFVRARSRTSRAALRKLQAEVDDLRSRLHVEGVPNAADPLDLPVPQGTPEERLQALDSDPLLGSLGQFERLKARQAIADQAMAGRSSRQAAAELSQRRVYIAEQAARIDAASREIERLKRERADLRVEASRRDAERARAEAEQLRLQAQLQAEEAQRLQERTQQAEAALDGAVTQQQDQVESARAREAALARKEAELTAGASLPPVRTDARGEVFSLDGNAFASGQAELTADALASVRALGIYLAALPGRSIQVVGHTDSQGAAAANQALSERRAQQVRATLVAAGLDRGWVSARGVGSAQPVADNGSAAGRAKNRRVEVIVSKRP
ncbi:MAG: OmpA family protein [Thermomonas sp.]|uniref:OmpA family protein n=1 Tax=Thermomonas sp. TaxID=1971895 RepID=UPI00260BEF81|nr:OmpA family protein [Thermomonas sp.]MCC7096766.1 OmpA family protein [Thermomonas sp.]